MVWSRLPFLKLLFPFILGLLIADRFGMEFGHGFTFLVLCLMLGLLLCFNKQMRLNRSMVLHLLFSVIAYEITLNQILLDQAYQTAAEKRRFIVEIEEVLKSNSYYHRYRVSLRAEEQEGEWMDRSAQILLKQKRQLDPPFQPQDLLLVLGEVNPILSPVNPTQFDYANYLKYQHVHHQMGADTAMRINNAYSINRFAYQLREKVIFSFQNSHLSSRNQAILTALILGDKSALDVETKSAFSGAGAMHVLAVSGLHLGIVFLLFSNLFKLFRLKDSNPLKTILMLTVIWSFAVLSGMSDSVLRSALMFSLMIIGRSLNRSASGLNAVAASALILLLLDPLRLFQVGFQLSYAAVFGILLIYPPLSKLLDLQHKMWNKVVDLLLISTAAQLATLPFTLAYFHQFPNFFLLTNLFVIPLAFLLVGLGLLFVIALFIDQSAFGLDHILQQLLDFTAYLIEMVSNAKYATTEQIWFHPISICLIACMILLMIRYLHSFKSKNLLFLLSLFLLLCISEGANLLHTSSKKEVLIYAHHPVKLVLVREGFSAVHLQLDSLNSFEESVANDHLHLEGILELETIRLDTALKEGRSLRLHFFDASMRIVPKAKKNSDALKEDYIVYQEPIWGNTFSKVQFRSGAIGYTFIDSLSDRLFHNLRKGAYRKAF